MADAPIENHLWLLARFADLLWLHEPRSLLDVGCGAGRLLRAAGQRGIPATGVDRGSRPLEQLSEEGLDVQEARAEELPFANDSFDWVTLRHVPHHLSDPAAAMTEALRVARVGVLVAEPWFDTSVPSQAAALELDRFEKRQHRRAGRVHGESLRLGELLDLVPATLRGELDVESCHWLRLRERNREEALAEARALLVDLPKGDSEHAALMELATQLAASGLSWNGSVACVLRKPESEAVA